MPKIVQQITKKDIQELLNNQTMVILDAVDAKITKLQSEIRALDLKFSQKIDQLTTTLDKFLKRMTDMEDEFAMMKHDLNKMKKILREKLGVDLS